MTAADQTNTVTKFCVNCENYQPPMLMVDEGSGHCMKHAARNLVTGVFEFPFEAKLERSGIEGVAGLTSDDPCGPEAKHFVPRKPAPMPPGPSVSIDGISLEKLRHWLFWWMLGRRRP